MNHTWNIEMIRDQLPRKISENVILYIMTLMSWKTIVITNCKANIEFYKQTNKKEINVEED